MITFSPAGTEGPIAIAFIVFSFVLLVILITTCTICWCWRYKLHKRKTELKANDAEHGIVTRKKSSGCCRCCGCWIYCCRCCRGCCDHKPAVDHNVVVVQPMDVPPVTTGCGGDQFGWSKDAYVYNNAGPMPVSGGCGAVGGGCSSQPVNFNNRWSSSNDGRLILNGGGIASKFTSGASPYGGIYPTVPGGGGPGNNQFVLYRK